MVYNVKIKRNKTKGQSLVEVAISLPLFLMLIAGIIEVGNLLVQRQRMTTAVDQGVRFGSRGGTDEGVYISAYNVLTQTMPIGSEELWDVFVVRGQMNADGDGWLPGDPTFEHVFGLGKTDLYTNTFTLSQTIGLDIINGLTTRAQVENDGSISAILQGTAGGREQAQNEEIVGLIMGHKAETILGLDDVVGSDVVLSAQKFMTIHAIGNQTDGCDLYPIGISLAARNLEPSSEGSDYYAKTSNTLDPFGVGDLAKYNYPASPPLWTELRPRSGIRDITTAAEGDIFVLYEGTTFRWAKWLSTRSVAADMAWPGTTQVYVNELATDTSPGSRIHVGDRVFYDDAGVGAWGAIEDHIAAGRSLRVPMMATESTDHFKVGGFVIIKILGYSNDGDGEGGRNFVVAEVARVDTSCGQVLE